MLKHINKTDNLIDVESLVMSRIKEYEDKKIGRLLWMEYFLSGIIISTGIAAMCLIQYFINKYSYIFDFFSAGAEIAAWFSMITFGLVIITVICIFYYINIYKKHRKIEMSA